jgi:hypothetical protein
MLYGMNALTNGLNELDVDMPLTLEQAKRILGLSKDEIITWMVRSGKLAAIRQDDGTYRVSYSAIEDYWHNMERAGKLVEAEREQGRRIFTQEHEERRHAQAEGQVQVEQQVSEIPARRVGLDRRRAQRREYARNWEHREPEHVLARLGEGGLSERFTFAQAAAILGVPQNHVYTFAGYGRDTYWGDHPRRLQSARDDRRLYTTRRWLLEHVERWKQHRVAGSDNEQKRHDAFTEAKRLDAEGVSLYCNTCDVEIGWSPPEPNGMVNRVYCIACGVKEREARLAALGD